MRYILLLLLIILSTECVFSQPPRRQKVRGVDLTESAKDTIRTIAMSFVSDSLRVFNIVGYGADRDSSTSDSAAWAAVYAALPDSGGTIYFPEGGYDFSTISDEFNINKKTTWVLDEEAVLYGNPNDINKCFKVSKTINVEGGTFDSWLHVFEIDSIPTSIIKGMSFENSTYKNMTGNPIYCRNLKSNTNYIEDINISDNKFLDCENGVLLDAIVDGGIFHNNTFRNIIDNDYDAIGFQGAYGFIVGEGSTWNDSTKNRDLKFTDNAFINFQSNFNAISETHAILAYGYNVKIIGNHAEDIISDYYDSGIYQDGETFYVKSMNPIITNNTAINTGAGDGVITSKGGQTGENGIIAFNIIKNDTMKRNCAGIYAKSNITIANNKISLGIDTTNSRISYGIYISPNDSDGGSTYLYDNEVSIATGDSGSAYAIRFKPEYGNVSLRIEGGKLQSYNNILRTSTDTLFINDVILKDVEIESDSLGAFYLGSIQGTVKFDNVDINAEWYEGTYFVTSDSMDNFIYQNSDWTFGDSTRSTDDAFSIRSSDLTKFHNINFYGRGDRQNTSSLIYINGRNTVMEQVIISASNFNTAGAGNDTILDNYWAYIEVETDSINYLGMKGNTFNGRLGDGWETVYALYSDNTDYGNVVIDGNDVLKGMVQGFVFASGATVATIAVQNNFADAEEDPEYFYRMLGTATDEYVIGNKGYPLNISNIDMFWFGRQDTVITGELVGWKVPYNLTITKVSAYTDANTTTFNIEERGAATPNVAGTNVFSTDMVAVSTGLDSTSFTNAGFIKGTWMCPNISLTDDVERFGVTITYYINDD